MSLEAVIAKHTEALTENTAVITKHIELQEQILALASARTGVDASGDKPATRRRAAAKDTAADDKADAGNADASEDSGKTEAKAGPTLDEIKAKLSPWATQFKENPAEAAEHNARTAALQETYGKLGVKKLGEITPADYAKFFKWVNKVVDAGRITPELSADTSASDDDSGDDDL